MDGSYSKHYSDESLHNKLKKFGKAAGAKVVYVVLLLFYAMKDKSVGLKTKLGIAAALGYFILPTDAILDLTPLIGYTDDLGVLMFALSAISANITSETRQKARNKLHEWFGEIDPEEIKDIENKTS